MNRHDIITLPHDSLRKRSKKVRFVDSSVHKVISRMKSATLDWEQHRKHEVGVALAAVQINQLLRIIIIRNNIEDKADKSFITLINPEIIKRYGQVVQDYEGCLSVRDIYGFVPRHSRVKVRAIDDNGSEIRITANDFMARILQHEIDHLNGKLFIDHVKDNHDAFYRLTNNGELEPIDYDKDIVEANLFR